MRYTILIPVILAALMIPTVPAARVYIWTDSEGVKHFSQEPPADHAAEVTVKEEVRHDPSSEGKQFRRTSAREPSSSTPAAPGQTRIVMEGNVILVPATISYKGREVDTRLVLDTGASSTVLTATLADRLEIPPEINVKVKVAGGKMVDAQSIILDSLRVGPHTRREVRTLLLDHKAQPNVHGVLGLNFLRHYPYSIDMQKMVISWRTATPATDP